MTSFFDFPYNMHLYRAKVDEPTEIGLALKAGSENPNTYYAEQPKIETITMGSFVGSVKEGGAVNYQKISFTPHGNGTHTECYGHISDDPEASFAQLSLAAFYVCHVISLQPEKKGEDSVLTLESLKKALPFVIGDAVAIRTLPNLTSKKTQDYNGSNPCYLEPEICTWLRKSGVKQLLVDLPSIDPEVDGGKLLAHRNFWLADGAWRKDATITELIYIPDSIKDGLYLLNLQIIRLDSDASPSRPVLYPLSRLSHEPK
jgi:arylformamidase